MTEMDVYDLVQPVDISPQIQGNFYTQMESKKWSDRKEALDNIEKATSAQRIQPSDNLRDLVTTLKKTIAKDSNIVVVTLATKCLYQLAQGMRTDFRPYADSCLTVLFEKFKEKKPNVVATLREATDACFVGSNLEEMHTDIIAFLDNKNPQIKAEMGLFLARNFAKFPLQVRNKKILKPLVNALIKTLSDMDATVRDNSAQAIGTAMKVIGENLMMPLIADVEPIKITKIKEFCEKAEIIQPQANGQEHGIVAQTNGQTAAPDQEQANGIEEDDEDEEARIYEMLDAVDISPQIQGNFYTQMESKKWSDRKEALDNIEKATSAQKIQSSDNLRDLVTTLKKTIAKDSNIVVVTLAAKCLCQLARGMKTDFRPYADSCLTILFEKFKEKKPNVVAIVRDATDACFVGTNLEEMHADIITFLDNKNPQIKAEMALFLARVFAKYPAQVLNKKTLRPLINALIKTLSDMDATVRENSAQAIGTAMKVTGEKLMMTLIADVEPIKIPKIKEFCEKAQVKKVPKSAMSSLVSTASTGVLPGAPAANNQMTATSRSSSATMIRSTSNRRLSARAGPVGSKTSTAGSTASVAPSSNATVKRTATIIKRSTTTTSSTVPKRASGSFQPPSQAVAPAPHQAPNAQTLQQHPPLLTNNNTNNNNNNNNNIGQHEFAVPHQPPVAGYIATPTKPTFAPINKQPPTRQENLDITIFRLISDNHEEVIASLDELADSLTDESELVYKGRINQIIDLACLQLVKSFYNQRTNSDGASHSVKITKSSDFLMKVFNRKHLVAAASQQSIRYLLVQIFTLTQSHLNLDEEDEIVRMKLNNLASTIMDSFEPASMMCILTGILNEPSPTSIVEPIKDAIIRSMRSIK